MVTTHPGLLILLIGIGMLFILISRLGRIFAIVVLLIVLVIAGKNVFMHEKACPRDGHDCFVELQPTWAGPCMSGDRSGVLKLKGSYFLSAEAGVDASASCIDFRFWQ